MTSARRQCSHRWPRFQLHHHRLFQRVIPHHRGLAHARGDALPHLGHFLLHGAVLLPLVSEAAHQAAAGAGNLHRVKRQVLLLGHLDGDRAELGQEARAAQLATAPAEAPQQLGLVATPHLAQLHPDLELAGQSPHQLAEIDPLLGAEQECQAAAIEAVLGGKQLHRQVQLGNHLAALDEGFLRLGVELLRLGDVLGRGLAYHRA